MRAPTRRAILFVLLGLPWLATAAPGAKVRLLQSPAWLERGGERVPLRLGAELASGDRVVTGARARVILTLEEGSLVKLGERAELDLTRLEPPAEESGVFEGFLDVLKGAFRFTTTLAARKRSVDARIRSATIGIRGTDVWGKAEDARDFVVLLEGEISIEREGERYALDEPLSLFMAPRGAPAEPVRPVDPDDLGRWAQETEPQEGEGVRSGDGRFLLNLASFETEPGAAALRSRLGAAGHAAEVASVEVGGRTWWRVTIGGFASRADAAHLRDVLAGPFGLASPWIAGGG